MSMLNLKLATSGVRPISKTIERDLTINKVDRVTRKTQPTK